MTLKVLFITGALTYFIRDPYYTRGELSGVKIFRSCSITLEWMDNTIPKLFRFQMRYRRKLNEL